jgi:hypothetical protein
MSESKMSWDEIKKLYPDEWVIVVDYESDPLTVVAAGRVVEHGKDRGDVHHRLQSIKEKSAAIVFTGKPRANVALGLSRVVRDE